MCLVSLYKTYNEAIELYVDCISRHQGYIGLSAEATVLILLSSSTNSYICQNVKKGSVKLSRFFHDYLLINVSKSRFLIREDKVLNVCEDNKSLRKIKLPDQIPLLL